MPNPAKRPKNVDPTEEKNLGGRPTKLTDEITAKVVDAILRGATFKIAAYHAGITEQTFYNWINAGEKGEDAEKRKFFESVKAAESECALGRLDAVRAGEQNWQSSAWLLERRYSEGYRLKSAHEHTGPDGGPIAFTGLHTSATS